MLSEEEKKAIEDLKDFKSISILYGNTFIMFLEQLKKYQEATDTALNLITKLQKENEEKDNQIEEALDLIFEFGGIDGAHHKAWVIDQIVRKLTKDKYDEWVKNYVYDKETGDTYSWDKGIAP